MESQSTNPSFTYQSLKGLPLPFTKRILCSRFLNICIKYYLYLHLVFLSYVECRCCKVELSTVSIIFLLIRNWYSSFGKRKTKKRQPQPQWVYFPFFQINLTNAKGNIWSLNCVFFYCPSVSILRSDDRNE